MVQAFARGSQVPDSQSSFHLGATVCLSGSKSLPLAYCSCALAVTARVKAGLSANDYHEMVCLTFKVVPALWVSRLNGISVSRQTGRRGAAAQGSDMLCFLSGSR